MTAAAAAAAAATAARLQSTTATGSMRTAAIFQNGDDNNNSDDILKEQPSVRAEQQPLASMSSNTWHIVQPKPKALQTIPIGGSLASISSSSNKSNRHRASSALPQQAQLVSKQHRLKLKFKQPKQQQQQKRGMSLTKMIRVALGQSPPVPQKRPPSASESGRAKSKTRLQSVQQMPNPFAASAPAAVSSSGIAAAAEILQQLGEASSYYATDGLDNSFGASSPFDLPLESFGAPQTSTNLASAQPLVSQAPLDLSIKANAPANSRLANELLAASGINPSSGAFIDWSTLQGLQNNSNTIMENLYDNVIFAPLAGNSNVLYPISLKDLSKNKQTMKNQDMIDNEQRQMYMGSESENSPVLLGMMSPTGDSYLAADSQQEAAVTDSSTTSQDARPMPGSLIQPSITSSDDRFSFTTTANIQKQNSGSEQLNANSNISHDQHASNSQLIHQTLDGIPNRRPSLTLINVDDIQQQIDREKKRNRSVGQQQQIQQQQMKQQPVMRFKQASVSDPLTIFEAPLDEASVENRFHNLRQLISAASKPTVVSQLSSGNVPSTSMQVMVPSHYIVASADSLLKHALLQASSSVVKPHLISAAEDLIKQHNSHHHDNAAIMLPEQTQNRHKHQHPSSQAPSYPAGDLATSESVRLHALLGPHSYLMSHILPLALALMPMMIVVALVSQVVMAAPLALFALVALTISRLSSSLISSTSTNRNDHPSPLSTSTVLEIIRMATAPGADKLIASIWPASMKNQNRFGFKKIQKSQATKKFRKGTAALKAQQTR